MSIHVPRWMDVKKKVNANHWWLLITSILFIVVSAYVGMNAQVLTSSVWSHDMHVLNTSRFLCSKKLFLVWVGATIHLEFNEVIAFL